jgi:hypothetical protein
MSESTFLNKLEKVIECEYTEVLAYFILKTENGNEIKKADFRKEVLNTIKQRLIESLKEEKEKFEKDNNRCIIPLSQSDDRKNVVYQYDFDDELALFKSMELVYQSSTDIEIFNFDNDNLSDIEYFLFEIGTAENKIVLCRKNYPFNLIHQGKGRFFFTKSDSQFELIKDDILRIDSSIDVILADGIFYIINLTYLDINKDFAAVVTKRAKNALSCIKNLDIADIDCLTKRLSDVPFARRLIKISSTSPVLKLPATDVIKFVQQDTTLSNVLKINAGKIDISTKKAQNSFIKLLNDDYLYSKLTKSNYETVAKNKLEQ